MEVVLYLLVLYRDYFELMLLRYILSWSLMWGLFYIFLDDMCSHFCGGAISAGLMRTLSLLSMMVFDELG